MRSESLGEYYKDCFIIKCHVPIDFNAPIKDDNFKSLGTFFHEYFHFIQSTMTTYGNIRMSIFYARMMNVYNQLAKGVPIEDVKLDCDNIESVAQQTDIALGDMDEWTYDKYDFIDIKDIKFKPDELLGEYAESSVPVVGLRLVKSRKIEDKELNFGAMCIMESMADMLERHLYGKRRTNSYIQYEICEMIWIHELGKNDNDWEQKLFLCMELALMQDNPAQAFICFIRYTIKINKQDYITDEYIVEFFSHSLKPNYLGIYKEAYDETLKQFNSIVPASNSYTKQLNEYVVDMMNSFYKLRKDYPLIFTYLYKMSSGECKKALIKIMHIGVPLIIDNDNNVFSGTEYAKKHTAIGMEEYAAMYALYRMVGINRQQGCILKDLCISNKIELIDDKCESDPLAHGQYKKLCLLGQLLYMWQIARKCA